MIVFLPHRSVAIDAKGLDQWSPFRRLGDDKGACGFRTAQFGRDEAEVDEIFPNLRTGQSSR